MKTRPRVKLLLSSALFFLGCLALSLTAPTQSVTAQSGPDGGDCPRCTGPTTCQSGFIHSANCTFISGFCFNGGSGECLDEPPQ